MKNSNKARFLALSALIAGLYTVLTVVLAPISFGPLQFRLSEGLNLLAFFFPQAIPGLAVGCFLANLLGGGVAADIIVGTIATLAAAYLCNKSQNVFVAGIYPVVLNTVLVAPVIVFYYMGGGNIWVYLGYMGVFALCEAASVYAVGLPLVLGVKRALSIKKGLTAKKK